MTHQINSIYPLDYFDTDGNEYNKKDARLWWSSLDRYASDGSEYVEIDLGRRRTVNYLSLDVIKKPIDITIEYDSIDTHDIDAYSDTTNSRWVSVQPTNGELFDSNVSYQAESTNPWKHCEFFFTDSQGSPLICQRIRIKFDRKEDDWPTGGYAQFPWSVDVRNLRIARVVSKQEDTIGVLIDVPRFTGTRSFSNFPEVRQRFFVLDQNLLAASSSADLSNIDSFVPSDIMPSLMGFEVLVKPTDFSQSIALEWMILDVTGRIESTIHRGVVRKTTEASVLFGDFGDSPDPDLVVSPEWVRVVFDHPVLSSPDKTYEIRIRNSNSAAVSEFYVHSPNGIVAADGSTIDSDLYYADNAGNVSRFEDESMVYRVLADVGSSGKDLLGNEYREGVRYNSAQNAVDGKMYTNWTSFPNPSSEGVEALYFDIRENKNGSYDSSVIDAIEINSLTPGVMMNVYFSDQPIIGSAPQSIDDWENMMWTPVRNHYKINQKQTIDLPYPIMANWICLEFYNLQATPMPLPNYPILPGVEFKEFPDWVYAHNPVPSATSDEPYLEREKFVSFSTIDAFAPIAENQNGLRIYQDTQKSLEQNYIDNGFGIADPRALAKMSFSQNPYASPTITNVDTTTTLGAFVHDDFVTDYRQTYISEAQKYSRLVGNRSVSNANNRFDTTRMSERTLSFNRVCAHQYAVKKARFNKKAYVVSVSEVSFFKKDYTTKWDDRTIKDILVVGSNGQSFMIESSNWEADTGATTPIGAPIFVTYTTGDTEHRDELVYFESSGSGEASFEPVDLTFGGQIATNVIAYSQAGQLGEGFYRNSDFLIVYDTASKKNKIKRNDLPSRLVIPHISHSVDSYGITGASVIHASSIKTFELGNIDLAPLTSGTANFDSIDIGNHSPSTYIEIHGPAVNIVSLFAHIGGESETYASTLVDG